MRRRRALAAALAVALGHVAVVAAQPPAGALVNTTTRASVDSTGGPSNNNSSAIDGVSLSRDGRYEAFESTASDLVPNDTNGVADIFVRDLVNGHTTRVSVDEFGGNANGASSSARMSGDGRYVAFASAANDLVADDGAGGPDVFVRDLATGTTVRASVSTTDGDPDGWSRRPSISADGRYVAFESSADNLVTDDTDSSPDIFVRDMVLGTTVRASVDPTGLDPDGYSTLASISADGHFVTFASDADNLVAGDTNAAQDIFRRDLVANTTVRVSVNTTGGDPNGLSTTPSISDDGNLVVFRSHASNLVTGDGNAFDDVFLRNVTAGTTTRISVDATGHDADGASYTPAISGDGNSVVFASDADDLVAGDGTLGSSGRDIFLRDVSLGTTTRVSVDTAGGDPNGPSVNPAVSATGRVVGFVSAASDLVATDGNTFVDVFARDLGPGGAPLVSIGDVSVVEGNSATVKAQLAVRLSAPAAGTVKVPWTTTTPADFLPGSGLRPATAGTDYTAASGTVTFAAGATAGVVNVTIKGDTTPEPDEQFLVSLGVPTGGAVVGDGSGAVTIRDDDLVTGRVSVDDDPTDADFDNPDGTSSAPSVSDDGRLVAFQSNANDLVGNDGGQMDVFVRDLAAQTTTRVSVDMNGGDANGPSTAPRISANGRYVVFTSTASDLVPGDGNGKADVFVRDLQTGTTTRVSVDAGGLDSNGNSTAPSISGDGRFVAYQSTAKDIVSPDPNGATSDVFVRDMQTGATTRIGGASGTAATITPAIAANGRYVAVDSKAPLGAGDANSLDDIYRYDLNTATPLRVSVNTTGGDPDKASAAPAISADGTRVAFQSLATNLVAGDTNALSDVFVRNITAGTTALISKDTSAGPADGASTLPTLSNDGTTVGFVSAATDLVASDGNAAADVFVRAASGGGAVTRVSVDTGSGDANGASLAIALDRDAEFVAYATDASDTVPNDTNGKTDIVSADLGGGARVSVGDVVVPEGNTSTVKATFTITRSQAAAAAVAVGWQTVAGTATTPADFTGATGTATIPVGAVSVTVAITVKGDTTPEGDETFQLGLTSAASSVIVDGSGTATIRDDELP